MQTLEQLRPQFKHWEILGDMVDQCIDVSLNLSQSGHPGGSRSKRPAFLTTVLSGAMKWDIRDCGRTFADRFVLVAGHTNPMVYSTLAVFNEAMRRRYEMTKDKKYQNPKGEHFTLLPKDLLTLRQYGGLPGHAEVIEKTLFFKCNTGPSGHGAPMAAGQAFALKYAGASSKVFCFEGEFGFQSGVSQEAMTSAYGLGLGNLIYHLDWNNFGIDDRPLSDITYGTPEEWFKAKGWYVVGSNDGENYEEIVKCYHKLLDPSVDPNLPKAFWLKTRKGRGYGVYDNKSHGAPHKRNSKEFWATRKEFADKYQLSFQYQDQAAKDYDECRVQMDAALQTIFSIFDKNPELVTYLSDRLLEIAAEVPAHEEILKTFEKDPLADPRVVDAASYPAKLFAKAGESVPNRKAFGHFGAYLNALGAKEYGRPLALVLSADVAESTNILGFAEKYEEFSGYGIYNKTKNPKGVLLPQGIMEFANSGIAIGISSVNFARDPYKEWRGYLSSCSTYGAFSYLKFGPMRIYSQMVQDSPLKLGPVIWVAGHEGPETGEDSRTHFGIFSPEITQLFPKGKISNLYPWEHNEVPVMLAAALKNRAHIIALHLTRPAVKLPDREAIGMAPYTEASRGAYILRKFDSSKKHEGVVILRGTSVVDNFLKALPLINSQGPNVKVVVATSQDFFRMQTKEFRDSIIAENEWADSMVITNTAIDMMYDWITHPVVKEYSLSPDFDNEWRSGGGVSDVIDGAHLSDRFQVEAIRKFAKDRTLRAERVKLAVFNS